MKKSFLIVLSAFSVAALVACGDDVTNVTEVKGSDMAVLQKGEKLSKQSCDTTNIGDMFYVVDSSAAFICDGGAWVSMKGVDADLKSSKDTVVLNHVDTVYVRDTVEGLNGKDGSSCTAKEIKNGYKIVCGGDSVGVVKNGEKGKQGDDGKSAYELSGSELSQEEWIASLKGENGSSCSAEEIKNGYKIVCGGDSVGVVKNGEKGKQGDDGKSAYELAVEKGFEGSENEWLESLKAEAVYGQFVDERDGQLYRTVKIGNQTWMAQNLNYGDFYQNIALRNATWCGGGETRTENEGDCAVYGRLYTWAAAVNKNEIECGYEHNCGLTGTTQGICPDSWHLPDTTEWNVLFETVGGMANAGTMLKSVSGWDDYEGKSGNGPDVYGFSVLPAGYRHSDGYFRGDGQFSYFWSSSERDSHHVFTMDFSFDYEGTYNSIGSKNYAFSVRCLKD